ncbi:MAG: hypothetical protein ABTS16_16760 [Candidatus Accumulibacter phosphatis]|jgi:hypothetical protein|uniref:hypothetical protein n=1 Tax=Candidatus Accumulibacter contiguus TaxID=2954381 RepID=UPI00145C5738|nr:hypothetical protein [Candidatus Accumulibacter contiguus]
MALTLMQGALATLATLLGAGIAVHHPLWPALLSGLFVAWCLAVCWRPDIWLFVLPALLPAASFSAWTGWIGIDEFDLLVLGAAAGCHARMAARRLRCMSQPQAVTEQSAGPQCFASPSVDSRREPEQTKSFGWTKIGIGALAMSYLWATLHGLADAGGFSLGWFQGYEEPLNSLRTAKSFFLVLLLLPALRSQMLAGSVLAGQGLAAGMASGLGVVGLAVVWERKGYPGLLDFSTPYRSTALFWEMHVGGAAIDAFLALAVPFAAYAVVHARTRWRWAVAACLAVVAGHACLTTFSRAVYLGVGVSLVVLAWRLPAPWLRRSRLACAIGPAATARVPEPEPWRRRGTRVLVGVLILEVLAVLCLGDFMGSRVSAGERDLGGRVQHWQEGLSLLRAPSEWLLGRGLGRFPANYSQTVPGRALPGRLRIVEAGEGSHLRIFRTPHSVRAGGAFELLQRVPELVAGSTYTLAMDLHAPQPARLRVGLCQQHLLYAAACAQAGLALPSTDDEWQHFVVTLTAPKGWSRGWPASWPGFLSLRLEGGADFVDVDHLSVLAADGHQLLGNGDFSGGMAHWFFAGRHYFLPWHVDSLFLEMLIDQGAVGLLLLLGLLGMAFANLLQGRGRAHVLAPYLLAALAACTVVGVFSSVLDMPRSAFLFYLLLCFALFLEGRSPAGIPRASPYS